MQRPIGVGRGGGGFRAARAASAALTWGTQSVHGLRLFYDLAKLRNAIAMAYLGRKKYDVCMRVLSEAERDVASAAAAAQPSLLALTRNNRACALYRCAPPLPAPRAPVAHAWVCAAWASTSTRSGF